MKQIRFIFISILVCALVGCSNSDDTIEQIPEPAMYFPPLTTNQWETTSPTSLNWNVNQLDALHTFLESENSKSFMILVDGKIVVERYYNGHNANATWQWNSAGKTLVTATTGIAAQENLINLNTPVSSYLGPQWTSAGLEKENLIQPIHLLTMTSGLNDTSQLVIPANLTYIADAGSRWAYSNVFQKLMDVITATSNQEFQAYFSQKLEGQIGMDGFWNLGSIFKIYHSNTRSMARFGLLALNNGEWNSQQLINSSFFNLSVNSSQNLNQAYGYMWWLNGKSNFMLPESQTVFPGALVPNAPTDMYAAMGFAEQRLYIIPSENMVIVRMGDASNLSNSNFSLSSFDHQLWEKLNAVFNN